ncbi:membrane protein [Tetragenococcus muriaticus PMC-11-5]|uniref:Membrane protein n=1 Tax=Tetragenococcus muriaticus PMC-11-5 TaxID=1302649 RepID=A0A091CCH7_9ENTE|nr:membrane protein [Tetragenococcus muriaticus PMC-11-5]
MTILTLSKMIDYIFSKAYPQLFHFIMGVVLASTVMIVPTNYTGFTFLSYIACVLMLGLGVFLGAWMSKLEERYK